jgi:2-oxoglutarate ferredoxin oxidoreductase subunit beta
MPQEVTELVRKYLRHDKKFPHIWCAGCGNGIVLGSLIRAIDQSGVEKDNIVLVSGIGCSGRITVYVDLNTLHVTHGRVLSFATGIKLAKDSLKVITVMGDGDATAIGGNHFIHAARRNMDLTAIIINNQIYGMTSGQYSPTTPYGSKTTTSPYGHVENTFSISELAIAAGASFVARGTVYHTQLLDKVIKAAILKKGFSVVEIMSNCHTQYGRRNKMETPVAAMRWFRDHATAVDKKVQTEAETWGGAEEKIRIGVLKDVEKPVYSEEYQKIRERAKNSIRAKSA